METRTFIPQHRPTFGEEEREALSQYISSNDPFYTEFGKTKQFEEMIAEYTGSRHCIAMPNGTLSLSCALIALGVKAGDEVICPVLTMAASATSIQLIGAKPVFCKTRELTLDPDDVKCKITPKTKAVMFVSLNNHCSSLDEIVELCNNHRIPLLEDAAQSLGCWYNGRHVGTYGKIGSFSFSTPKIISTGQGGALITNDDDLAQQIRLIKNFGRSVSGTTDCYETFGINLKITDFQAVVGIEQMKKLKTRVLKMKHIYSRYYSKLSQFMKIPPYHGYIPWFICIYVDNPRDVSIRLKERGIGSREFYPVLTSQEAFLDNNLKCEESEKIAKRGLWLPSYITLEDDEIDYICETILSIKKEC